MTVKQDMTVLKIRGTRKYITVPLSLDKPNEENLIESHQLSTYMINLLKDADPSKYLIEYSSVTNMVGGRDVEAIMSINHITKVKIQYVSNDDKSPKGEAEFFRQLPKHSEEQLEELLSGTKGTDLVECYPTSGLSIGAGKSRTGRFSSVFFVVRQDGENILIEIHESLEENSKPIQSLHVNRITFKTTLSGLIVTNKPYEIEVIGKGRFELYSLISDIDSVIKGTGINVSIRARSSLIKEKSFLMSMRFPSPKKMQISKDVSELRLINKPVLISETVIKGEALKLYSCVVISEGKEVKIYVVFYDVDVMATIEDGVKYFNFDNVKPLNAVALTNIGDDACKAYSDRS